MNSEFRDCLKRNKIKPFSRGKVLVAKEIRLATSDLEMAKESFTRNHFKWVVVQSYYSMFHSGRALIYAENYREKSHYCLIVAIRTLYVEKRKLDFRFIEVLEKAKTLRENADYYGDFTKASAKDLIERAEQFLKKTKEVLKSN